VFAVSLILAFEALNAPVPGETLLIFASVLARRGEMSLPALMIFACAGSVGRLLIVDDRNGDHRLRPPRQMKVAGLSLIALSAFAMSFMPMMLAGSLLAGSARSCCK